MVFHSFLRSCLPSAEHLLHHDTIPVVEANARWRLSMSERERRDSKTKQQQKTKKNRHCVTFGHVDIREYEIILGDHPDCKEGPPLSLGWNYVTAPSMTVDKFESSWSTFLRRRRREHELPISPQRRIQLLKKHGQYNEAALLHAYQQGHWLRRERLKQFIRSFHDIEEFEKKTNEEDTHVQNEQADDASNMQQNDDIASFNHTPSHLQNSQDKEVFQGEIDKTCDQKEDDRISCQTSEEVPQSNCSAGIYSVPRMVTAPQIHVAPV